MTYNPTEWMNTVVDADGNVIQRGTPYSAENMNKIEVELFDLSKLPGTVAEQDITLSKHEQRIEGAETAIDDITTVKGKPNGFAELNADGIVPSSQLPSNLKEIRVVANMSERDALERFEGLRVMVMDASDDPTVDSGWAEYVWDGLEFIKAAEMESLDMILSWGNITEKPSTYPPAKHGHKESDITDLDKYSKSEVNLMLSGKSDADHKHTEFDIADLDKYTKAEVDSKLIGKSNSGHTHSEFTKISNHETRISDLEKSSGQLHTHLNKSTLDKLVYSGAKPTVDLNKIDEFDNHTHTYASLTDKPSIPSKTSEIENDSEFVKSNARRIHVSYSDEDIPSLEPNDIVIKVL